MITIDGHEVYLTENELPSITKAIEDPFDPTAIKGTKSTTFKFPMPNANRTAFGGRALSEATEPTHELFIGLSGVPYIQATIQPIERTRDSLEAAIVAGNAGWFTELRNTKIRDVDLGISEPLSAEYIQRSWQTEDWPIYFPLIDYGYDWASTTLGATIASIRPAIRVHSIISKVFADLGYSVKINGRLNNLWKKLILPNTVEKIAYAEDYLETLKLTLEQTVPSAIVPGENNLPVPPWPEPAPLPPSINTVTDPGGNNTNTYFYTYPLDMTVQVRVSFTALYYGSPLSASTIKLICYLNSANVPLLPIIEYPVTGTATIIEQDLVMGQVTLSAGQEIGVGLLIEGAIVPMDILTAKVEYIPVDVPYQEGVEFHITGAGPDMSVLELLKGVALSRRLTIDTDDQTKVVNIWFSDDYYKPHEVDGKDFSGRIDFTSEPVTMDPLRPKNIVFGWKEDNDDEEVKLLNRSLTDRTYGGYKYPVTNGSQEDKVVELPFAATAMKLEAGGCFIPIMTTDLVGFETEYNWEPRLLVADGMATGTWELENAGTLTEYPKSFFVAPGEYVLNCSFSNEPAYGDTGSGRIQDWLRTLRRFEGKGLRCLFRLADDELIDWNFGTPLLINDGEEPVWMYCTSINKHRLFTHRTTEVELIKEA